MPEWIWNWFTNMEPCEEPFLYDGISFTHVENFFQAMKTKDRDLRVKIAAMSPYEAKRFSKTIRLREDWEEIKFAVMEYGLRKKFAPGTGWLQLLLETGDEEIVETNNWKDVVWGVDVDLGGENHLGKLLMKLREEFKDKPDVLPVRVRSEDAPIATGDGRALCDDCDRRRSCKIPNTGNTNGCVNHWMEPEADCPGCAYLASVKRYATECDRYIPEGDYVV